MNKIVLDASAILAYLHGEPGGIEVLALLDDPDAEVAISSVNFCEVATRIVLLNGTDEQLAIAMEPFRKWIVPFEEDQADYAAKLVRLTKSHGLALGDRACLSLAQATGATAWTTDRAWKRLKLPVPIRLLRG